MSATCDIVGAERATLYLVHARSRQIKIIATRGRFGTTHDETDAPYGMNLSLDDSGVIAHVARTGEALNIADASADTRFDRAAEEKLNRLAAAEGTTEGELRIGAVLAMPLLASDGEILGVLQAMNKMAEPSSASDEGATSATPTPHPPPGSSPTERPRSRNSGATLTEGRAPRIGARFDEEDERHLKQLLVFAAVSLRNLMIVQTAEKDAARMHGLIDAVKTLTVSTNSRSVMRSLFDLSAELLGASSITLFTASTDSSTAALRTDGNDATDASTRARGEVVLRATHSFARGVVGQQVALGEGVVGWVAEHKRLVSLTEPTLDARYSSSDRARHGLALGDDDASPTRKTEDEEIFSVLSGQDGPRVPTPSADTEPFGGSAAGEDDAPSGRGGEAGLDARALLCAPVTRPRESGHGELVAVLEAFDRGRGSCFSEEDENVMQYFADVTGILIEKADDRAKAERERSRALTTKAMIELLVGRPSVQRFVDQVNSLLAQLLHCERFSLYIVDALNGDVWAPLRRRRTGTGGVAVDDADSSGRDTTASARPAVDDGGSDGYSILRIPIGTGIAGRVAESGRTFVTPDAYEASFFNPSFDFKTGFRTQSVLAMAVREEGADSGTCVAVVQAINKIDEDCPRADFRRELSSSTEPGSARRASNNAVAASPLSPTTPSMPGTPLPKHPRVVPFTDTDVAELENACSQLRSALREMILDANFVKMSADSEAPSTPKVPSPKNISGLADDDDAELHSPRSRLMSGHTAKATASIASEYRRTTTLDRWGGNKAVLDLSNVDEETAVEGGESSPTAAPSPKRLNARRKTIVDQMSTWDPDLLSLSHADLCLMVHESIAQSGLIEQLSLEEDACAQLIRVVSNSYRGNPYHNFHHAFQVGTRGAR